MAFSPPCPVLRIFDEAKARDHYLGFLGFKVVFEHRFEPGTPIYMGISRDACVLHLSEHHGDGSPGANVRIRIDELDAYCAALNASGYKYYRPGITTTEWHTREMVIADGFGNRLNFYEDVSRDSSPR